MKSYIKRTILSLFYPVWNGHQHNQNGYTVVIPAPMDMPFLAYYALKGLSELDLSSCREILVVPDGCGTDNGRALSAVLKLVNLDKARLLPLTRRNKLVISLFGDSGIAHWMTIVEAINHSETNSLFLHDADAFFTDEHLIENNYSEFNKNNLNCLGVTSRWDPFLQSKNMQLPGTWELFFSSAWARSWAPVSHKAGGRYTDTGKEFFDTMLYPMFRSYSQERIQVRPSESFMHLSGTVVTYRRWLDHLNHPVGDELFRLLFLSLLQELSPPIESSCKLPSVAELSEGIFDSSKMVYYTFPGAANNYHEFRRFVDGLLTLELFRDQLEKVNSLLHPFDEYFLKTEYKSLEVIPKVRAHGLYL